jgi:8-oxo-dGTP pyrophosphatase MutT (NUDIX family)
MKFLNSIEFRNFNIDMGKLNEISPEELSEIMKPGAAGVLVMTKSGEFLLTKRTRRAKYLPSHWSVPSGESNVNELESLEDCARREFFEETGHQIPKESKLFCIDRYFADKRMYFLFLYKVDKKIPIKIDWEHEDVNWFTKDKLPEPIAPQILDGISRV